MCISKIIKVKFNVVYHLVCGYRLALAVGNGSQTTLARGTRQHPTAEAKGLILNLF